MAEDKGTPDTKRNFPEVKGKIVDSVDLNVDADYYGITVRFQDRTALTFAFESCVFAFPALEDWTQGEAKIIKNYDSVQSSIMRE